MGAALFAVFCGYSINKPLTTDETEFAAAAIGILTSGGPVYYVGETPDTFIPDPDRWIFHAASKPGYQYGLWHSSGYTYLIALSYKIFGRANWAARLPGLFCTLLTLWLLCRIAKLITPLPLQGGEARLRGTVGTLAFLYLINPLILQEGLMIDLDNTIVSTFCVWFLHEYLRMELAGTAWRSRYTWLIALMAMSFWTKEFTGIYLTAAVCAYEVLSRRWTRLLGILAALGAGAAVFWGTWWTYCKLSDLPATYFLRFTVERNLAASAGLLTTIYRTDGPAAAAFRLGFGFIESLVWVSPFFGALILVLIAWRLKCFWHARRPAPLDLLLIFALVILFAAKIYRPSGFLKYEYPAYGALTLLAAVFLRERFGSLSARELSVAGILAGILAAAQVYLLGDPVRVFFDNAADGIFHPPVAVFYLLAALDLLIILIFARRAWGLPNVFLSVLVIGLAGANLGLGWAQRGSYVTSIDWNNYAEVNLEDAAGYLKSQLREGDVPICRKDIGFYLNKDSDTPAHPWINTVVIYQSASSAQLLEQIRRPEISHIVLDRYSYRVYALPYIAQHYALDRDLVSFQIYRRLSR